MASGGNEASYRLKHDSPSPITIKINHVSFKMIIKWYLLSDVFVVKSFFFLLLIICGSTWNRSSKHAICNFRRINLIERNNICLHPLIFFLFKIYSTPTLSSHTHIKIIENFSFSPFFFLLFGFLSFFFLLYCLRLNNASYNFSVNIGMNQNAKHVPINNKNIYLYIYIEILWLLQ